MVARDVGVGFPGPHSISVLYVEERGAARPSLLPGLDVKESARLTGFGAEVL
jgi:hypothetical protein